jgi:hypothetical protein
MRTTSRSLVQDRSIDAGLLVLRIGIGVSFAFLVALKQSEAAKIFVTPSGRLWPLLALSIGACLVVFGFFTELAAALSALGWAWAMYSGLRADMEWIVLPVRAAQYVIVFSALGITGPGSYSFDYLIRTKRRTEDSRTSI